MNHNDFECRYCGAVFEKRTEKGACPCCGAPNPRRVAEKNEEPRVEVRTVYKHVYVPETRSTPARNYYVPPKPKVSQRVFSKLGFRITVLLAVALAIFVVYMFIQAFKVGDADPLTNEQLQKVAPTVEVIVPATQVQIAQLENKVESWLTPIESATLRDSENVTNLIVLDPDEVKIAATQTLEFSGEWEQTRPYFVEGVSVIGTQAVVEMGGSQYNLNVYMPFIWADAEHLVTMIDTDGTIWVLETKDAELINLSEIDLPLTIKPNENLEIAFTKQ